jgi:hypothetical protein
MLMYEDPDYATVQKPCAVRMYHKHTAKGTYFFDYGNAFLLEASRAGAAIMAENNIDFRYPSYKTSWDPCVLIMDLVPDGFASGNQKIYKQMILLAPFLRKWQKPPN